LSGNCRTFYKKSYLLNIPGCRSSTFAEKSNFFGRYPRFIEQIQKIREDPPNPLNPRSIVF